MQAVDPRADATEQSAQAVEALEPSTQTRILRFHHYWYQNDQSWEAEYIQGEVGFIAIQDLFTETIRELKKIVKGEYGINLAKLFSSDWRQMVPADFESADQAVAENIQLIEGFFNLVENVPALRDKIIATSLGVPRNRTQMFIDAIGEPPHRGGLTIDEGFDILRWFIRQNAAGIRRFFTQNLRDIRDDLELYVVHQGKRPEQDPEPTAQEQTDPRPGGRPSSTSWQDTQESPTPA
jgi:hypothetical protein